ncbi:helix-turn-helix transcriptional regulator [Fibrella sp. ES10-3-2-2]|nr:hypothetical protein A6C57_08595 [Fibrella sp. ES10-3-2-2]
MNLTDKYDVAPGFEDLFTFANETQADEHEAQMIAFRFLSEVQKAMELRGLSRKELAKQVNTSASYITQIFRGDKLPNFDLLARMQRVLDITFDIRLTHDCPIVSYQAEQSVVLPVLSNRTATRQRPQLLESPFGKVADSYWPMTDKPRTAYA